LNHYYSFPCRLLAHSCAARRLTRGMRGPTCHGNGKGPGDGTASGTTVLGVADKGPDPSRGAQRTLAHIRHDGPHPGPRRGLGTPRPHPGPHGRSGESSRSPMVWSLAGARKQARRANPKGREETSCVQVCRPVFLLTNAPFFSFFPHESGQMLE
jgi:hypothetical protein